MCKEGGLERWGDTRGRSVVGEHDRGGGAGRQHSAVSAKFDTANLCQVIGLHSSVLPYMQVTAHVHAQLSAAGLLAPTQPTVLDSAHAMRVIQFIEQVRMEGAFHSRVEPTKPEWGLAAKEGVDKGWGTGGSESREGLG